MNLSDLDAPELLSLLKKDESLAKESIRKSFDSKDETFNFQAQNSAHGIQKILKLRDSYVSKSLGRLTGLVIATSINSLAEPILRNKEDLCAGISVYDLVLVKQQKQERTFATGEPENDISNNSEGDVESIGPEEYSILERGFQTRLKQLFERMSEIALVDFSLHETQMKSNVQQWLRMTPNEYLQSNCQLESNDLPAHLLGGKNCMVSIVKSFDQRLFRVRYHMVIKSYDPIATYHLTQFIKQHAQQLTMGDLLNSSIYKKALLNSLHTRDAIASKITAFLDCDLKGDKATLNLYSTRNAVVKRPRIEQFYNIVHPFSGKTVVFYDNCFHIGEERRDGIIVGLRSDIGFVLYEKIENKKRLSTFYGNEEMFSSLPMNFPVSDESRTSETISSNNNKNGSPKKTLSSIVLGYWGAAFDINPKWLPSATNVPQQHRAIELESISDIELMSDSYIQKFFERKRAPNERGQNQVVYLPTVLTTEICYISSPMVEKLGFDQIISMRRKADVIIRIPITNEYMLSSFMKDYVSYRKQNTGSAKEIGQIIIRDDSYFFYLDALAAESVWKSSH